MSARSIRRARSRRLRRTAAAVALSTAALPAAASADFTVTTTADGVSAGTLRKAIIDANATVAPDTITFAPGVTGTINLTGGEMPVIHGTTIVGPGAGSLTISAPSTRAFFFNPGSVSTLTLQGVSVSGKSVATPGGAIGAICPQQSSIALRDMTIIGSSSTTRGGGLFVNGCDVSIEGSTITGNAVSGSGSNGNGGGVYVYDAAGGGSVDQVIVTGSRISGNTASEDGGGLQVTEIPGSASITRSTFAGNITSGGCGCGGGVWLDTVEGPISVDSSTFSGNIGTGGGMLVSDQSQSFLMRNSTVTGNTGNGGGLYFENDSGQTARIENSTISGNSGDGSDGGGIYFFGFPVNTSTLTLSSTIVSGNSTSGGGRGPDIWVANSGSGATLLDNSIVGDATGIKSLIETAPGTNQLNTGPIPLGPLADNGGPTQTMLPAAGSIAIDKGAANGLTTDQRGLARTVRQPGTSGGDGTDVGAAELQDSTFEGADLKAKKKQKAKGKKVKIVVSVKAGETATATVGGTVKLGKKVVRMGPAEADLVAGATKKVKLKPTKKNGSKQILKVLKKGKKARVQVSVAFADPSGNSETKNLKVTLRG